MVRRSYCPPIEPGDVITFTVGGTLIPSGRTEDAYVGNQIQVASTYDSFGSFLGVVLNLETWWFNNPQIKITDPNGIVTNLSWWLYDLPTTAPTGIYNVHLDYYTGPYQGWLSADSQFQVLPQQTSAIISPDGGTLYSTWDDTLYEFPSGTFTDTVIITHTVVYTSIPDTDPLQGIGHFFEVTALYIDTGLLAQPTQPYTITIGYYDWQQGYVNEASMGLYFWDSSQWLLDPSTLLDPSGNHVIAIPDHFSTWGILGETNRVFLSLVQR
jgi:hypothetical protein